MKKLKFIIIFCLFLILSFISLLFLSAFYDVSNNKIYNYGIHKISSIRKISDICVNKISKENLLMREDIYRNNNNPSIRFCIEILESSPYTQSLITSSYYEETKAINELEKHVKITKKDFANNKEFLKSYMEKNENLKIKSQKLINKEFPDPFDGRETPIYIRLYNVDFLNKQKIILEGFVYEYCINYPNDKSCKSYNGFFD